MSNPQIQALTKEIAGQARQLEAVLPAGIDVSRFMRTAVNGISSHAQSDRLLAANRDSLFRAIIKAASDGLSLDGREATLVVFGSDVGYIPMTQGLVKLARNSGEILKIEAYVVFEQDDFKYSPGIDAIPVFSPDWFKPRGKPIGAYCVITLRNSDPIITIMPAPRIAAIGNVGRNGKQYDPVQGVHFEEWWKKTVIKNALKYAPRSSRLDSAMEQDNKNENVVFEQEPPAQQQIQQKEDPKSFLIQPDSDEVPL